LPPVLLTPVANMPPVLNDSGGKFATGVVDTGGAPLLGNISSNFQKKSK
jgi:hypothetical protein